MESANLVSSLIKKKKMKGFHSAEHGAEEMKPEEAMEVSESSEKYASPLMGAKKAPMGELATMEKVAPSKLGTIKPMSSEDSLSADMMLKGAAMPSEMSQGGILEKAKSMASMAPKSEEEAKKHQKLMESIKAYEEQLKKLQGK
jgi:hypothetical protein